VGVADQPLGYEASGKIALVSTGRGGTGGQIPSGFLAPRYFQGTYHIQKEGYALDSLRARATSRGGPPRSARMPLSTSVATRLEPPRGRAAKRRGRGVGTTCPHAASPTPAIAAKPPRTAAEMWASAAARCRHEEAGAASIQINSRPGCARVRGWRSSKTIRLEFLPWLSAVAAARSIRLL
jgi:hypothetical protein